jgi:superfamily II DNA or RNA helicase
MWDAPAIAAPTETQTKDPLRPYQREAVEAVFREWKRIRATLLVTFTSSGKSRMGGEVIRMWLDANPQGRALWLAENDFLIDDARRRLRDMTGIWPSIEKAGERADGCRVVVGSVQTLRGERLESWRRDHFGVIVYDEAKHSVSPRARQILAWFESAKVLGMDATPGRLDGIGMHNVYQSVALERGIGWGIANGYFVPPKRVARYIKGIDLTDVATVLGDLRLSDLEEQIVKNAAAIAKVAYREAGDRPTLIYTPGVVSAHAVAATLNQFRPGCAVAVDGETPKHIRDRVLGDFRSGAVQYVVNCMIYREGLDLPNCRCVVIARLTKSISLYEQMLGRGGRLEPGDIGQLETVEERLAAIAASDKPHFLLVDVTGKPGRHKIASILDVLGGNDVPPEVLDRAKKIGEKQPDAKPGDLFTLAEEEIAEEDRVRRELVAKAAAAAKVTTRRREVALFKRQGVTFDESEVGQAPEWVAEPPTQDDIAWLKKNNLAVKGATKGTVAALRRQAQTWYKQGRANFKQRNVLSRVHAPVDVGFDEASELITMAFQNGGGRYPRALSQAQIDGVLKREIPEPGWDG